MKTVIGLIASLAVNGAILGMLDWSAQQAQAPPGGEVLIMQLPDPLALPAYADARPAGVSAARAL